MGILYALVPMFAWGSIGFASNKIGGRPDQQTFGMTLGALVFALGVYMIVRPELDMKLWVFGILGGILWSIGQNGQFHAMKAMGVSVGNPLSAGSQLLIGSLIGAFVFNEWTTTTQYLLGSIALVSLLFGFYFLSKKDSREGLSQAEHGDFKKGLFALTYSTFGYLAYAILFNNIMKFDALSVIFPMSVGMVLGALMFMSFKLDFAPVVLKNMMVGFLWGVGNIFMLLAAASAGLAIAFSFSQLGAVISIFGGIIFLGETKTKKEMRWIWIGIICFVIGAGLLGFIKA
ncbi:GRP family sugar transporter [Streptococcus fryi]